MTALLASVRTGDESAEHRIVAMAYDELRQLAHAFADGQRFDALRPTSLVHEVWLKLAGNLADVNDRRHFFALAARAMRQVVADAAKARGRDKRGGGRRRITISSDVAGESGETLDAPALHAALSALRASYPRHAEALELRILGAMTHQEIAEQLGVAESTVRADVKFARAWLFDRLLELDDA